MPIERRRRQWTRQGGVTVALVVLALGGALALSREQAEARRLDGEQGKRLFEGALALHGTMVGHTAELPAEAARCSNCHPTQADRSARPGSSPVERFAPLLTRSALTEATPRRGGPASSYDPDKFCRLLTSGIDPAHVMVAQTMPRYRLSTEECQSLWTHVTSL